jgi:hypothetical protein
MDPLHRPLIVRCTIVLALLAIGYSAVSRSFAAALSKSDPLSALTISGGDARIMASAAQEMLERAQTDDDRRTAEKLAVRALAIDGTAIPAVTTVGFSAGAAGNEALGARWLAYSEKLSRRDFRTQTYFIEKSVMEGSIDEALRHYDTALRTSDESAPTVLFPVLRSAIADQAIRRAMAKTLAGRPLWSDRFIDDLVNHGPDLVAAAQLLVDAKRLGAPIVPQSEETLLRNLAGAGQMSAAWRYYTITRPAAGRLLIRNGTFRADGAENSPFDWQLLTGDGVSATLGAGENGRTLEYQLSPTISGAVVRQTTLLPAGKYRLQSVLMAASQDLSAGPYWDIKCADGRSIGTLEMGGPIEQPRGFSAEFTVPSRCAAQIFTLIVRPSDDIQGATGQLSSVSLSRIGS